MSLLDAWWYLLNVDSSSCNVYFSASKLPQYSFNDNNSLRRRSPSHTSWRLRHTWTPFYQLRLHHDLQLDLVVSRHSDMAYFRPQGSYRYRHNPAIQSNFHYSRYSPFCTHNSNTLKITFVLSWKKKLFYN